MRWRWKITIAVCVFLAIPTASYFLYYHITNNFHIVIEEHCYRSGQPSPGHLQEWIAEHQIRTVINLRGPNPGQRWYDRERNLTAQHGVKMVDVILSAYERPFENQLHLLINSLEKEQGPILVHCFGGSDRAGFASAMYLMLKKNTPPEIAHQQLSYKYFHFPYGKKASLPGVINEYAQWLRAEGLSHSPEHLKHWGLTVYRREPNCSLIGNASAKRR